LFFLQLPDKSLKSIICYYYLWKKKKTEPLNVKPTKKSEHFCADKIQNGSSDEPSSAQSKPDNLVKIT